MIKFKRCSECWKASRSGLKWYCEKCSNLKKSSKTHIMGINCENCVKVFYKESRSPEIFCKKCDETC